MMEFRRRVTRELAGLVDFHLKPCVEDQKQTSGSGLEADSFADMIRDAVRGVVREETEGVLTNMRKLRSEVDGRFSRMERCLPEPSWIPDILTLSRTTDAKLAQCASILRETQIQSGALPCSGSPTPPGAQQFCDRGAR